MRSNRPRHRRLPERTTQSTRYAGASLARAIPATLSSIYLALEIIDFVLKHNLTP